MTRDDLYDILRYVSHATDSLDLIWGQPFDGETEKIAKKDDGDDHETTNRPLELAYTAIRTAVEQFDRVNWGWEGDCGSKNIMRTLEEFLPILVKINTTKSGSPTSPTTEQADHETAEEKVAWLKILLCTKSCDPVFTDYWLRLARRNLRLGLPLTTPEPELNPATEQSSATDHFRDATKMVSGESSAPTPTQPNP